MRKRQKRVALFWGEQATGQMLVEECSELIQALIKYERVSNKMSVPTVKTKEDVIDNIAEEIADVRICLDEMEYLLGLEDRVKKWRESKEEREYSRMLRRESELLDED